MHHQIIPSPPSDATAAAKVAAAGPQTEPPYINVPADVLVSMASSVIDAQRRLLAERDLQIGVLRALLKAAADAIRPPGCVLQ